MVEKEQLHKPEVHLQEVYKCEICKIPFNHEDKKALLFPCGHTCCLACIKEIQKTKNAIMCPFDKKTFQIQISDLPQNNALYSLLDSIYATEKNKLICTEHIGNEIQWVCNCQENMLFFCSKCIVEKHRKHQNFASFFGWEDLANDCEEIKSLLKENIENNTKLLEKTESIAQSEIKNPNEISNFLRSLKKNLKKIPNNYNKIGIFKKIDNKIDSIILTKNEEIEYLKELLEIDCDLVLIFRASSESYTASDFFSNIEDKFKTLIVIKAKKSNEIFGGYNPNC